MGQPTFSARYRAAEAQSGGTCPIEAGLLGRLADHECPHGRLPFDRAAVLALPWRAAGQPVDRRAA